MKIAIIHYSMYGHVATMSEAIKKGVLSADPSIQCDIYQVPETLPDDVLEKMYAPPKGDYPIITKEKMPEYDGFLFGISGRFGMMSAQMRVRPSLDRCVSRLSCSFSQQSRCVSQSVFFKLM
jgi:NAD(P)H dehydrogenase (quinone)